MGGKVTKEERDAVKFVKERLIAKIECYKGAIEARIVRQAILGSKKLAWKKEGEILAVEGEIATPFMLIEGAVYIGDFLRRRTGLLCTECFFNLGAFHGMTAATDCTILLLNPRVRNLDLRRDYLENFIRYVPIYPVAINRPQIHKMLDLSKLVQKCGEFWWSRSIAASALDRATGLWHADAQFDVIERPDYRDDIIEIMEYFNDQPRYIAVGKDDAPLVIQKSGEIPTNSWVLLAGNAEAQEDEIETITDDELVVILETNVCMQYPVDAEYRIMPGSIAVSIGRKTMLAIQFMKAFAMECAEAIDATNQSKLLKMKPGERIEEDKWFKGIILGGKLSLVALPPGRASEHEKIRRTIMEQRGSTMSNRKSCRIATELEYGFEKCGPFDEFVAMQPTWAIITTGIPQQDNSQCPSLKLSTIKESEEQINTHSIIR